MARMLGRRETGTEWVFTEPVHWHCLGRLILFSCMGGFVLLRLGRGDDLGWLTSSARMVMLLALWYWPARPKRFTIPHGALEPTRVRRASSSQ